MKLTFRRQQLIEQVEKNHADYQRALLRANEGWRIAVRHWLTTQRDALDGLHFNDLPVPFNHDRVAMVQAKEDPRWAVISCPHRPPPDHRADYQRILQMLSCTTEDVITLTEEEYDTCILDRWKWKVQFDDALTTYTARLPDAPILDQPVEALGLTRATLLKVHNLGIIRVSALVSCSEHDLTQHPTLSSVGSAELAEIKERLAVHHLSLHPRRSTPSST